MATTFRYMMIPFCFLKMERPESLEPSCLRQRDAAPLQVLKRWQDDASRHQIDERGLPPPCAQHLRAEPFATSLRIEIQQASHPQNS